MDLAAQEKLDKLEAAAREAKSTFDNLLADCKCGPPRIG
jgi:hypothetical protein